MDEVKDVIRTWAKFALNKIDTMEWVQCLEDAKKEDLESALSFLAGYFSSNVKKLEHLAHNYE